MVFGRLRWDEILNMGIVEATVFKSPSIAQVHLIHVWVMLQVSNNDRLQVCHDEDTKQI